jgi:hypothetical protein
MVANTYKISTWEVYAGESESQGCLWLYSEWKTSLDYIYPFGFFVVHDDIVVVVVVVVKWG